MEKLLSVCKCLWTESSGIQDQAWAETEPGGSWSGALVLCIEVTVPDVHKNVNIWHWQPWII